MMKYLLAVFMLLLGAGAAHACNVPNPNLLAPPFVDGCAVPAVALNKLATNSAGGFDARVYGATCGASDSTAGIQAAVNAASNGAGTTGGTVLIACPMTVATGNINLPAGIKFWGSGAGSGYSTQTDIPGPSGWPPILGGSINCTNTANACFNIVGEGVDIGYLVVGNPEPPPPNSGSYTPTVFPYIFATSCGSSWQSLHMHDMTFVSSFNGIDLEGCPNYTTNNTGGYTTIEKIWFNAPLNVGLRAHLIDYSPLRVRDIEGWPEWYANVASLGAYQRANLLFFDIEYCAACMINGVETPPAKYGIFLNNGTVNNPGTITLAYTGTMSDMNFQNSCQAIVGTNTNLSVWLNLTNSIIWGDQSGFKCSQGLPMISLPSNLVYLGISNMDATSFDTLLSVGCGTPGVGACPGGAVGGSAYVRLSDLFVNTYATNTATAALIQIPSTTVLSMQNTDPLQLIPFNGTTGKLFAAGFDGTTGCDRPFQAGGGINQSYNAATLTDSCGQGSPSTTSGGMNVFVGSSVIGQFGFGNTAQGVNITANKSLFLNSTAGNVVSMTGGAFLPPQSTVAGLPTCNAGAAGWTFLVTDQNGAPTYLGALTGSGTSRVLAVCDSTWKAH